MTIDCEEISPDLPIRQGDVLKRIRPEDQPSLVIVITADCDIANHKVGDAGLACVQLVALDTYMLGEHARALATKQLKKRNEKLIEWISKKWVEAGSNRASLSPEAVMHWTSTASVEEIEKALALPQDGKASFVRRELEAIKKADKHLQRPSSKYDPLDSLRALQSKDVTRAEQLKTLFGTLDPGDLPLDMFFINALPGEPNIGYIAKLRSISFVPVQDGFTSVLAARDQEKAYVRIGRLAPTFRHGLAQQFGMLFARIGFPKDYESDRDATYTLVAEQLIKEAEELQ